MKIQNRRVKGYLTNKTVVLKPKEFKKLLRLYPHKVGSTKEHWDARLFFATTNLESETPNITPASEVWYVSIGDNCYETYLRYIS